MYDLVKQVRTEVQDYLTNTISITSIPDDKDRLYEYKFSQRQNIALIDLYYNSQFSSGKLDSQGLQKIFINKGKFRTEVAEMQIDMDVSNFLFVPTGDDYWTPFFMSRDFMDYVRENDYGEIINDWGADLPRYGTAIGKRVGDVIERKAISRIYNTQDAKSLKDAAISGGYVIEAMQLTPHQMEKYPDWRIDALEEKDKTQTVYERYGLITEADIEKSKGKDVKHADSENFFLGMAVVATNVEKDNKKREGALLFAEEVKEDDFPYEEVHWARQDGRWQGIGVMEEQFQNQLAANLSTHYRMKSMYWAGKRMFQKNTSEGADNLAMEVQDGGVIDIGTNGRIDVINTQTQHLGDFNAFDQMVDNNADQTSFTYEAATGDSPKAGTPYSLQVKVDDTLQKHFGKKKERYAAFLRRVFFNQQVPIFKKNRKKEHTLTFKRDDDGAFALREAMIELHTTDRWLQSRANGKRKPLAQLRAEVTAEIEKSPYLVATIPKGLYDNAKATTDLILTGERRNLFAEMETLKTLLQDARATGDQGAAERHLREIIALTGKMPQTTRPQPVQPIPAPHGATPGGTPSPTSDLSALVPAV